MPQSDGLLLRPPRHRVERRAIVWWVLRAALIPVPTALVLGVLDLLIPPARFVFGPLFLAVALPGLCYLIVMPLWRYRVHRWETTDQAVYTASGWLWQRRRVAPLSRIQTVDTVRGPLEQLFGLSGIKVTTASAAGALTIRGLDRGRAAELVEQLTSATQATPGDAT
ncbi:PH domain-containing protein [Kitasatospora sp. GAS204B]|uniref:PH domain-containing protein n=1 Tax=unclassified Kitasatospora TaxID=2633591 RepID=UPI00247514F8|nr:PH domain-containing protein [Kitasatospora sp. GAS204B]MDH6117450.1 membrane protein YdbS with pleckstrin-like domain [Kitasatospora sp. GAS204B]